MFEETYSEKVVQFRLTRSLHEKLPVVLFITAFLLVGYCYVLYPRFLGKAELWWIAISLIALLFCIAIAWIYGFQTKYLVVDLENRQFRFEERPFFLSPENIEFDNLRGYGFHTYWIVDESEKVQLARVFLELKSIEKIEVTDGGVLPAEAQSLINRLLELVDADVSRSSDD